MFVITSTFNAKPLKRFISIYLEKFFQQIEIEFTTYEEIFHESNQSSELLRTNDDINIFLIRLDDYVRFIFGDPSTEDYFEIINKKVGQFVEYLDELAYENSAGTFVVFIHADSILQKIGNEFYQQKINQIQETLGSTPNIQLVVSKDNFEKDITKIDEYTDDIAAMPYTTEGYAALGQVLARRIFVNHFNNTTPIKAVILDCDNTLYRGIVEEDETIVVSEAYQYLQTMMVKLSERGILLFLCSHNDEGKMLEFLRGNKEMVLEVDKHVIAYQINSTPKPDNVKKFLEFSKFEQENVVYLDDSLANCDAVAKAFPGLLVFQVPNEAELKDFLDYLWCFDQIKRPTAEDLSRRDFYKRRAQRELKKDLQQGTYLPVRAGTSYFNNTQIDIQKFEKFIDAEIAERISEMTVKFNKFNCSAKHYEIAELMSQIQQNSNYGCLIANLHVEKENFGRVAATIYHFEDKKLIVENFLLSCRAFYHGVEYKLLEALMNIAVQSNVNEIVLHFTNTGKNRAARDFFMSIENLIEFKSENGVSYCLPVLSSKTLTYKNNIQETQTIETKKSGNPYRNGLIEIATKRHNFKDFIEIECNIENKMSIFDGLRYMVKKVSGIEVELDQDLICMGIDSCQLILLSGEIYQAYKVRVNQIHLQTIRGIGKEIQRQLDMLSPAISTYENLVEETEFALSPMQESLWFDEMASSKPSAIYNLFRLFRVKGSLLIHLLEDAARLLIGQYDSLRISIHDRGGKPYGKVSSRLQLNFNIEIHNQDHLGNLFSPEVIKENVLKPFNLEVPPLFRMVVLQESPTQYVLAFIFHHVITDGWSISKFIDEFSQTYNKILVNGSNKLIFDKQQKQFIDYIKWQQKEIVLHTNKLEEFWQQNLSDFPQMNLPYDVVNEKAADNEGGQSIFHFDKTVTRQLEQICIANRVTLYELMLFLYFLFFAKNCNQDDIAIVSAFAVRPPEFTNTLGCLVNLFIIRKRISNDSSFLDFLIEIKQLVKDIKQNNLFPFNEAVKIIKSQSAHTHFIFPPLFAFENYSNADLNFEDSQISEINSGNEITLSDPSIAKFPFVLYAAKKKAGQIQVVIEYQKRFYTDSAVRNLTLRFEEFTKKVLSNLNSAIRTINILTEEDQRILEQISVGPKIEKNGFITVISFFRNQVKDTPNNIALINERDEKITYAELDIQSNKLANFLRAREIKKGTVLAVKQRRDIPLIISLLAIQKLGCVYLPLDPDYPDERINYIVRDAGIKTEIITTDWYNEFLPQMRDASEVEIDQAVSDDEPFCVIYTSGSTGNPKGIITSQRAFINLITWSQDYYRLNSATRNALTAAEGFDAFGWQLWPYLTSGGTTLLVSKETLLNMDQFVELLNNYQISICFVATPYADLLLQEYAEQLKFLRFLLTGGDRLTKFPQASCSFKVINHYGLTECAVVTTAGEVSPITQTTLDNPTLGKPIANTYIRVLDECRQQVPWDGVGELYVGGMGVAAGYINQPEKSEAVFLVDPLYPNKIIYKTGDKVRQLLNGEIEYLGRLDNCLKLRGYRIYPEEVESQLQKHPFIKQVAVILHEHNGNLLLVAYVTLQQGTQSALISDELRRYMEAQTSLPGFMRPHQIIVLEKLPQTQHGKIDRKTLANRPLELFDVPCKKISHAENEIQIFILSCLFNLLKEEKSLDSVSIDSDLIWYGVHSLILIQLLRCLQQHFNIQLSVTDLYPKATYRGNESGLTVRRIASFIQTRSELPPLAKIKYQTAVNSRFFSTSSCMAQNVVVLLRKAKQNVPNFPIFFIHPVGGNLICYQALINQLDQSRDYYGIQYVPAQVRSESVTELAADYLSSICQTFPEGPYFLVGHSFGGMLAHEIANQLIEKKQKVAFVGIIDTWVASAMDISNRDKLKASFMVEFKTRYNEWLQQAPVQEERVKHLQNIGFSHQPKKLRMPIHLFKATEDLAELSKLQDRANLWSPFASAVEVIMVPGNHDTLLDSNHVPLWRGSLQEVINSCTLLNNHDATTTFQLH